MQKKQSFVVVVVEKEEEEQDFVVHPRSQELLREIEEETAVASFLAEGAAVAEFGVVAGLAAAAAELQ